MAGAGVQATAVVRQPHLSGRIAAVSLPRRGLCGHRLALQRRRADGPPGLNNVAHPLIMEETHRGRIAGRSLSRLLLRRDQCYMLRLIVGDTRERPEPRRFIDWADVDANALLVCDLGD